MRLPARRRRALRRAPDLNRQPLTEGFTTNDLLWIDENFPILRNPKVVPARSLRLPPDDLVIGVANDGESRMYPVALMYEAHIANDRLAGKPLLLTFCRMCFSATAFDPVVDGRALSFHLYGLYRGNEAIVDDQTGTVWAQLTGKALVGPLAGSALPLLQADIMSARAWLERHPDSSAPRVRVRRTGPEHVTPDSTATRVRRRFGEPGSGLVRTVGSPDPRLPLDALVLGLDIGGKPRAYVLDPRRPGPLLLQDVVAGVPVALIAGPDAWPAAFDRRIDDGTVELRLEGDRIVDAAGATWTVEGVAATGSLRGTSLETLPSRVARWYGWAAAFPDSDIQHIDRP